MITQAITNSFLQEILQAIHDEGDTYKAAFYTSSATLGKSTTAYTATGEVSNSGTGYTSGGVTLTGFAVSLDTNKIILTFDTPITIDPATFTARGMLIYNASKSNKSVMVVDFGADKTATDGPFEVNLPAADASNGLIRINNA